MIAVKACLDRFDKVGGYRYNSTIGPTSGQSNGPYNRGQHSHQQEADMAEAEFTTYYDFR